MKLNPGEVFEGKYEIQEAIGEGGMGVVYRARQIESDRVIALKVLNAMLVKDEEHVKRFRREGRAISHLGHENIVTFYHFGFTAAGVPYAAMEYLEGKSLSKILHEESHLDVERCLQIIKQVCLGLGSAHEQGIVHRDLKPANIILVEAAAESLQTATVKVVDFGLAKLTEGSGLSTEKLTETGLLVGSVDYMSPEQVRGEPVDARADIYACGCVMYEALTGQRPFEADVPMGVLHKHCNDTPVPFSETEFGVLCAPNVEQVCLRAMEKDPNQRYQSMEDFVHDLEVLQTGQGKLLPLPDRNNVATPGKEKRKTSRLKIAMASVGLLLLTVGIGISSGFISFPSKERLIVEALNAGGPVTQWIDQPEAQTGPTVKAWRLIQDNPHTGEWLVILSSKGMVAANRRMGTTLVAAAPTWNVCMYNDKTKVYFLSPLAEWKGAQSSLKSSAKSRQAYSRATTSLIERPPHKLREEMVAGYPTALYLTDNLVTTGLKKVEFNICSSLEASPQLQQVFGKIYGVGLTKLRGLPLKVAYIDEKGKRSPVFETRSIAEVEVPFGLFSHPPNYKRVDSEIAVLMDQKGREAMAKIMEDNTCEKTAGLDELLEEKSKVRETESDEPESEAFLELLLPAAGVLVGLAIIGGALFFLLRSKLGRQSI